MNATLPLSAALLVVLASCAAPPPPAITSVEPHQAVLPAEPDLADAVRVYDTAARATVSLEQMIAALAEYDVVFFGETHLDDTTHRLQAAVYDGLIRHTGGRVVLSMEMFERDVQRALDAYLEGRVSEAEFLAAARPWGNYASSYRPLVETARQRGLPVRAANAPVELRRAVAAGGQRAFDALPAESRKQLAPEILPASADYWKRVDRATRGHMGGSGDPDARRFSTQNLWDNSMAHTCAESLQRYPGHLVLHVVGSFHVSYGQGTVEQLRKRMPDARIAVLNVEPASDLYSIRPERDRDQADYLVHALALGRAEMGGTQAVMVQGELRYHLDAPAPELGATYPLLVWLPDSGERAEDARQFWHSALGDEALVAVVNPPYPQLQDDMARGGAWYFPDSFRQDQARVMRGLERLVAYVSRQHAVDPERILVAGRGTGGLVATWAATYSNSLGVRFAAVEPSELRRLRMNGLPDNPPVSRSLDLIVRDDETALGIVDDCHQAGVFVRRHVETGGGVGHERLQRAIRRSLGMPAAEPAPPWAPLTLLMIDSDSPRAREWAELHAQVLADEGTACRVVTAGDLPRELDAELAAGRRVSVRPLRFGGNPLELAGGDDVQCEPSWQPDDLSDGVGVPVAPGAFGGTTVLVVPADALASEREAWRELESLRKPRVRVAFAEGGPPLSAVLDELRKGWSRSVLVAPAAFCATPSEMQELRRAAGSLEGLDVSWLPGLGAESAALLRGD